MHYKIEFFWNKLKPDSGIKWETPIAHLIPWMPFAMTIGDILLEGAGGFSVTLGFWWHICFLDGVVQLTLQFKTSNNGGMLVLVNVLEFVMVIINHCAALYVVQTSPVTDNPHPVILNVTDNSSGLSWTLHTCKWSKLGKCLLVSPVHCWLTCLLASIHNRSVQSITRLLITFLVQKNNLMTSIHPLLLVVLFSNRRTQSWDIVLSSRFSHCSSCWYGTLCWTNNGPITKWSRPWNRGCLASSLNKVGQNLWHTNSIWLLRRFHKDCGHLHKVRPVWHQLQ